MESKILQNGAEEKVKILEQVGTAFLLSPYHSELNVPLKFVEIP